PDHLRDEGAQVEREHDDAGDVRARLQIEGGDRVEDQERLYEDGRAAHDPDVEPVEAAGGAEPRKSGGPGEEGEAGGPPDGGGGGRGRDRGAGRGEEGGALEGRPRSQGGGVRGVLASGPAPRAPRQPEARLEHGDEREVEDGHYHEGLIGGARLLGQELGAHG